LLTKHKPALVQWLSALDDPDERAALQLPEAEAAALLPAALAEFDRIVTENIHSPKPLEDPPPMTAQKLLDSLTAAGFRPAVRDGKLYVEPRRELTPAQCGEITRHRDEMVRLLTPPPTATPTASPTPGGRRPDPAPARPRTQRWLILRFVPQPGSGITDTIPFAEQAGGWLSSAVTIHGSQAGALRGWSVRPDGDAAELVVPVRWAESDGTRRSVAQAVASFTYGPVRRLGLQVWPVPDGDERLWSEDTPGDPSVTHNDDDAEANGWHLRDVADYWAGLKPDPAGRYRGEVEEVATAANLIAAGAVKPPRPTRVWQPPNGQPDQAAFVELCVIEPELARLRRRALALAEAVNGDPSRNWCANAAW
jgi:hypothetical protein